MDPQTQITFIMCIHPGHFVKDGDFPARQKNSSASEIKIPESYQNTLHAKYTHTSTSLVYCRGKGRKVI